MPRRTGFVVCADLFRQYERSGLSPATIISGSRVSLGRLSGPIPNASRRVDRCCRGGDAIEHLVVCADLFAAHPDRTLAELKDALATPASVPTVWRAVRALGLTVKKNGPPVRTRSA